MKSRSFVLRAGALELRQDSMHPFVFVHFPTSTPCHGIFGQRHRGGEDQIQDGKQSIRKLK
eukprot:scaffold10069_cov69-Cylindrotheca_fusiformis.AAC.7